MGAPPIASQAYASLFFLSEFNYYTPFWRLHISIGTILYTLDTITRIFHHESYVHIRYLKVSTASDPNDAPRCMHP